MNGLKKKIIWAIIVVAVLVLGYIFLAPRATAPGVSELPTTTIKVGGVVPLTGDGAAYGLPVQRAASLAVNEINLAGGVKGQPLEIVWEDGKCDAKEATSAVRKLVTIDAVKIILGGVCSSETLAMAPITEAEKVIVLSPSSTSPDITTAGDFVFRTAPSDALAGRVAAEYAVKKFSAKKSAIISETKDYAQGLRRVFKEVFTALGGTVAADEVYNTGDTNFRSQLLKIKVANPDVLYVLPQTPASGVLILKQLKDLNIKTQLLTAEAFIGRDLVKEQGKNMEGLVGVEQYFDEKGEKAQAFLKKYKDTYNEEPPFPAFMANMYSQVYLVKEAMEKYGQDTEKIRDYFLSLKGWEGALGRLTFDGNGDPLSSYAVKKVESGKLVDVEIYNP
ncbi:ABC transporter substrate-binding protein [Candidatus Uhrbacteria bacterium]|nr:ABC transporter substrate-binding protein [Candidatus Uhrbacteria bacterium]